MSYRYVQPLRNFVQIGYFVFLMWLWYCFYLFVQMLSSGDYGTVVRPDSIEGFLPISGLLGVSLWLRGGGINVIHPAAVVIFLTVIVVSLLLRRSFCSWVCPVATVSELLWKIGFKASRRNWRMPLWLDIILRSFKYLLLVFFMYSIVISMSTDSLTNFIQSDYHKLADVRLMRFFLQISLTALSTVLVLVLMSFFLRNPFCRFICPYGALLGLVATLSPVRVTRNSERCVSCGACSQVCPTYIDVMNKSSVASPECIGCWRCISHCRFNEALSMRLVRNIPVSGFIVAAMILLLFWGGATLGKLNGHWYSAVTIEEYVRLLGK